MYNYVHCVQNSCFSPLIGSSAAKVGVLFRAGALKRKSPLTSLQGQRSLAKPLAHGVIQADPLVNDLGTVRAARGSVLLETP